MMTTAGPRGDFGGFRYARHVDAAVGAGHPGRRHTQIELRSAVGPSLRFGPSAYRGIMLKRRR